MAHRIDLLRRRGVAEQDVDRIAGNEVDEGEDQDRRRDQRDDRRTGTFEDKGPHADGRSPSDIRLDEVTRAARCERAAQVR